MRVAESLRTQRLLLQPLCGSDTDLTLYRALYCDPQVMRHIAEPVPAARIESSFDAAWRESAARHDLPNRWSLRRLADGRDIGLLGAFHDPATRQTELGVVLLPEHQRSGYGSEALLAMAARLQEAGIADLLWCRHAPGNPGAVGIMQHCGFVQVAVGAVWRWEKRLRPPLAAVTASL